MYIEEEFKYLTDTSQNVNILLFSHFLQSNKSSILQDLRSSRISQ